MRIHALSTAAAPVASLVGSLMANRVAHDSLLVLALVVLLVQWYLQRRRQKRAQVQGALLATLRNLSEEASLLSCSEVASRHPELRCEVHIFERAVVRSLADLHHGRSGTPALSMIERFVTVTAPQLLKAIQIYDDKVTLQNVCRQFRLMSQQLLPKVPNAVSTVGPLTVLHTEAVSRPQPAAGSR